MDGSGDETLAAFLDRLASGVPAPGGGAAAALAGATAAALVAMACRVTARRTPSESIAAASESAETYRDQLLTLMREDADAYAAVLEARRAPPDRRASLVQSALQRATAVPLNTASAACAVLELCATILDAVRPSTVGDLGVAVALGAAAVDASTLTARINLQDIPDGHFTLTARQSLERVERRAGAVRELAERIATRAGLAGPDTGRSA
jgi:formiminotetrahydrofolate cyclodeaminase